MTYGFCATIGAVVLLMVAPVPTAVLAQSGQPISAQTLTVYRQGVTAYQAGNFQTAVQLLERSVKASATQDPRAQYFPYYYLAETYLDLGLVEKARENLDKALRIGVLIPPLRSGLIEDFSAVPNDVPDWYVPYLRGIQAFKEGRYRAAIPRLEQALKGSSKQSGFPSYFPYYYLGASYFETGRLDRAQQNFAKATPWLPAELQPKLADYEQRAQFPGSTPAAGPPAADRTASVATTRPEPPPQPGPEPPPPAAIDAKAQLQGSLVRQAVAALSEKRYAEAIAAFDAARNVDPAEYTRQNLESRREEAARGLAGQRLAAEGRQLLQSSQLGAAKARLQQADQTLPGQPGVSEGLAEIRQRELDFDRFKAAAEEAFRANNLEAARSGFEQSRAAHAERFQEENLEARLKLVTDRISEMVVSDAKQAESTRLVSQAKESASQGRFTDAEKDFSAAVAANPKNQEAVDALQKSRRFGVLKTEAAQLTARGSALSAQQRLTEARRLDPTRFEREGLQSMLDRLAGSTRGDTQLTLRNALALLVQGDANGAIALLEPAIPGTSGPSQAPMHGYLGVAYATRGFLSTDSQEQAMLRQQAIDQFRLALSVNPNYVLSSRLVAPKILALFAEARKN